MGISYDLALYFVWDLVNRDALPKNPATRFVCLGEPRGGKRAEMIWCYKIKPRRQFVSGQNLAKGRNFIEQNATNRQHNFTSTSYFEVNRCAFPRESSAML